MSPARGGQLAQRRSRETRERILRGAAEELLEVGSFDDLSTTAIAERLDFPIGTVYRYFTDRSAIVATLLDRDIEAMNGIIERELRALETVNLDAILRLFMEIHDRRLQEHPLSKLLWFDTRGDEVASARIAARGNALARWAEDGAIGAGLAEDFPTWAADTIVWVCDRTFELMFRASRDREEELEIMYLAITTWGTQMNEYATPAGIKGVPVKEFLAHAGPLPSTPEAAVLSE